MFVCMKKRAVSHEVRNKEVDVVRCRVVDVVQMADENG